MGALPCVSLPAIAMDKNGPHDAVTEYRRQELSPWRRRISWNYQWCHTVRSSELGRATLL